MGISRSIEWYRDWETWLTGAVEGTEIAKWNEDHPGEKIEHPKIEDIKWNPWKRYDREGKITSGAGKGAEIGTVWESLGLPYAEQITSEPETTNQPIDLPKRAYNKVYNDWYRDQNLQKPVHLQNDTLLRINWRRDRFTAAGYEQQKGVAPAIGGLGNLKIKTYEGNPIPDNGWIHKKENGEIVTRKSYMKTSKTTSQDGMVIMNLPDMPSNIS